MDYSQTQLKKQTQQLRDILETLPPFVTEFFRGMSDVKTITTRVAYAYDLRAFFTFLFEATPSHSFSATSLDAFTLDDLAKVTTDDIERFLEYMTLYTKTYTHTKEYDKEITNAENGKSRKLSSIRTLYNYFINKEKLVVNPAQLVNTPRIKDKHITKLEVNEVALLLDDVEAGSNLTDKQLDYHSRTRTRDLALLTLLLGTGIRVSECVGINIPQISFDDNYITITRKGGAQAPIYFGDEVREALLAYLLERQDIDAKAGHEDALFLSLQKTRITPRAVQNLVKKYAKASVTTKNISPHKLRSTYGTNLYRETGDIYLVATTLGHKDVNTTKKFYASMDEDRKRSAANVVKLRKN